MMTREQLKNFFSTPKGKLTAVCSLLAVCWIFLFFYFFGDTISALSNPHSVENAEKELKRLRGRQTEVADRYAELVAQRKRYNAIITGAWLESRNGQVETALRQKITEAVTAIEFKLSSLGSVNTGRINNDLYYADIDVSAEGAMDEIIKLISALEGIRPAPAWKRLNLRPDNRPRPQTRSVSTLNLANLGTTVEYSRLSMNGTLRIICADEAAYRRVSGGERRAKP